MNEAEDNPVRILTDIQILQSPQWSERTHYLRRLESNRAINGKWFTNIRTKALPFFDLIKILKYRNKYDVIINGNIRTGQLFALFRRLFRNSTPKHMILELMLDEERKDLRWKIKRTIQKVAFSSADLIFVSSTGEIATYCKRLQIPKDRFRFLPFHTNVIEPRMINHSTDYILSAGKTGRDYATLADAVAGIKKKVIVVSDTLSVKDVKFPPNVKVLLNIPYSNYLDLLYNCLLVVVPLHALVKSTGQVAILEAMALGKPVIATRATGTVDYIQSGVNGVLVPIGDSEALAKAMMSLTNDATLYKSLASNALESVKKYYTFDMYTGRIMDAAWEITGTDRIYTSEATSSR